MTKNSNSKTTSKTITNWLIINWQDLSTRTRKSKPDQSKLGTHELATKLQVEIVVPKVDVPELAARVEVPAPLVETAALDDLDEEDIPDWKDVARDVVAEYMDDGSIDDPRDHRSGMVIETMRRAQGRPEVEDVERHVRTLIDSMERKTLPNANAESE